MTRYKLSKRNGTKCCIWENIEWDLDGIGLII